MLLSDILKGGQLLQAKAGNSAINANDLLVQNSLGQLFSMQNSDTAAVASAGAWPVSNQSVVPYSFGAASGASNPAGSFTTQEAVRNTADGSVLIATPNASSNFGLRVSKYNSAGTLITSVVLSSNSSVVWYASILPLSNGNYAVVWSEGSGATVYFAIIDQYLTVVVAQTTASSPSLNMNVTATALSGGGFALAYGTSSGVYLAIYTNTGSVTFTPTLLSSSPTTTFTALNIAQISNGNIVIAAMQPNVSNCLSYTIRTNAGATSVAWTTLNTSTSVQGGTSNGPFISVLTGFFCVAVADGTNGAVAYVLSNTGTLQGSAFKSSTFGGVLTSTAVTMGQAGMTLLNDGTAFWLIAGVGSGAGACAVYLPTTGTGYVATLLPTLTLIGAIIERGFVVLMTTGGFRVYQISTSNNLTFLNLFATGIANVSSMSPVFSAGDFCFGIVNQSTGAPSVYFGIVKYLTAPIVGVSPQALAAGNAGTMVTFNQGPGAFPTNTIIGSNGKNFSHRGGNRGTLFSGSAVLAGVSNPRPIN